MEIGLNLYSIRNHIQTENEFVDTCKILKDYGYSFVQYSSLPIYTDWIQREIKEAGLPVVLTHVSADRILNDLDNVIKEHKSFNCKNIGIGGLFGECGSNFETFKKTIDELNIAAKKIKEAGMEFFYHNHMHEFQIASQGKTWFDYIVENAKNINFTLDTYWVYRGGADIYDVIDKIKGRVQCVHFKDHSVIVNTDVDAKSSHKAVECACGDGTLDFKKIYKALKKAGVKHVIVEQDNAAEKPDTFNEVKKSIEYLNKLFN